MKPTPENVQRLTDRMMSEIEQDMEEGHVPHDINSFSDLHNHLDATYYGGGHENNPETGRSWWDTDTPEEEEDHINLFNQAYLNVDQWLHQRAQQRRATPKFSRRRHFLKSF